MPRFLRHARNERGATFVFFVAMIMPLLSLVALAADVGAVFTARGEAQRAAEAAALAGAGLYVDGSGPTKAEVEDTARAYAGRNHVGATYVDDGNQVLVEVVEDQQFVRVTVEGSARLLFARLLGMREMEVKAVAAARVMGSGAAKCVKPFAIPDLWDDADGDRQYDAGERYQQHDPASPDAQATGYGSSFRNGVPDATGGVYTGDYGRSLSLTATPGDVITPSIFWPLDMGVSEENEGCEKGGGGKDGYRENICACNPEGVPLGDPGLPLFTGASVGQTKSGLQELIEDDPAAVWDQSLNDGKGGVRNSVHADWMDSERVIKVAMFDPSQMAGFTPGAGNMVKFNNIALFFVESFPKKGGANTSFRARFLYYAQGEGAGEGTLVRSLQLVE